MLTSQGHGAVPRRTHIVVITMRTVLVALVVLGHVLPESLLALLAHEHHLHRLRQLVRLRFRVTFRAVEPLLAARRADGDLRVQDVLAVGYVSDAWLYWRGGTGAYHISEGEVGLEYRSLLLEGEGSEVSTR